LLTIEGKWVEVIMHMTKFAFLNLICLKQVQIFISFVVNHNCCPHLVGIKENIQQFISQVEVSLHGEILVAILAIVPNDDAHYNMKCKLDFDELKSNSTQKTS
jgi:hypothetical protein